MLAVKRTASLAAQENRFVVLQPCSAKPISITLIQKVQSRIGFVSSPHRIAMRQSKLYRAWVRIDPAMDSRGRILSTAFSLMASLGMPKTTQVASS